MTTSTSTNPLREGLSAEQGAPPCTFVIFGASGDLTKRKLVPALYNLAHLDLLEGRLDAAIAGFRRSIAIEASDPRPHCGLASALAAQGDDDAAARSRAEARRLLGDEGACPD